MSIQDRTLAWSAAEADFEATQRDDLVQLGVWIFLATVVMLFAAFASAYIVRRSASDWVPVELPRILWANTAVLLASSAALELARRASQSRRTAARYGVATAAILGFVFLGGQVTAWRDLASHGAYLPTSPHGSFVYVLTGAHGMHVLAGLALLICAAARMWMPSSASSSGASSARLLNASATFWHFLAALWLFVFLFIAVV